VRKNEEMSPEKLREKKINSRERKREIVVSAEEEEKLLRHNNAIK
jgi:hypothetical protein